MVYLSNMNLEVSEELKYGKTKKPKIGLRYFRDDSVAVYIVQNYSTFSTEILISQSIGHPKVCLVCWNQYAALPHWAAHGLSQGLLDGSKIENSKRSVCAGLWLTARYPDQNHPSRLFNQNCSFSGRL